MSREIGVIKLLAHLLEWTLTQRMTLGGHPPKHSEQEVPKVIGAKGQQAMTAMYLSCHI